MSLVVANASGGPTTITLSAITVSGIVTVKDSGSASATNVVTILATAGNTFESGLTSYTLTTASAYISFVGNASTLKWRVLGSTYADIPVVSPVPSPPALGGNLSATLSNLSVSGQTSLATVSATNINFTGGLYSNGLLFSGGSASPNFSTISTIGQAAFYSSVQIQGALGVAGAATFASTLMAPYVGINTANPTAALHVNGNTTVSGNVSFFRQILGNTSGYLLANTTLLSDQWNMTLNAYTSNGAWVVPTASIGTSRFTIQGAQFTWYWGAAGAAPTTQLMQLNTGGLSLAGVDLDVAANGNTNNDIRISLHHHDNPAVANERQFLCASATLNDISLGAGCHSSGANWNPFNTGGTPAVGFVSCRKGQVKIYTGNMTGATADSGLTGTLTASSGGNWSYSSDERIKENITPLENCLDFVKSVRTVKYSFINANSSVPTQIGFLAQDFQALFPEVVSNNDGTHLGLSYSDTIPIAVAAIKELNTIVETQGSTIIGVQSESSQGSTIVGIEFSTLQQENLELRSTIAAILEKYPL